MGTFIATIVVTLLIVMVLATIMKNTPANKAKEHERQAKIDQIIRDGTMEQKQSLLQWMRDQKDPKYYEKIQKLADDILNNM